MLDKRGKYELNQTGHLTFLVPFIWSGGKQRNIDCWVAAKTIVVKHEFHYYAVILSLIMHIPLNSISVVDLTL